MIDDQGIRRRELSSAELQPGCQAIWYKTNGYFLDEFVPVKICGFTRERVKIMRLDNGKKTNVKAHNLVR